MIKFGWRHSLLYPGLFIIFLAIRRIIKYILEKYIANDKFSFIMLFLIFTMEPILSLICLCHQKKSTRASIEPQFLGIQLIHDDDILNKLTRPDSNLKIIILVLITSYFEIIGALCRRCVTVDSANNNRDIYDEFHSKYRSSEIIISSILCYFALNNKIYSHHKLSLIIILVCLITIVATTLFIIDYNDKYSLLRNVGLTLVSSTCRAYVDTIEKYLFDTDFIDIYKLMIFEGIIDSIASANLMWISSPRSEVNKLVLMKDNDVMKFFLVILILIIYSIVSGLKNIFRRFTIKEFTPMTRALAESILDPFYIIFGHITKKKKNLPYFIITLICSIAMVFCSCVYNEIFVLYCCGLEKNTHLEIEIQVKQNLELINEGKDENEELN